MWGSETSFQVSLTVDWVSNDDIAFLQEEDKDTKTRLHVWKDKARLRAIHGTHTTGVSTLVL